MTSARRRVWLPVVALQSVVWVPIAGYLAYRWLFRDDPNSVRECSGRTCVNGETANAVLACAFGLVALVCVGAAVVWVRERRAGGSERARLLAGGVRVAGVVADRRPTGLEVFGERQYDVIVEAATEDGARPIEVVKRMTGPPPRGTPVTVVYDPARPAAATVVEDLRAVAAAARAARTGLA